MTDKKRYPAVLFRREVHTGAESHWDALNKIFEPKSKLSQDRARERITTGKEEIVFGYAYRDGTDFDPCSSQSARFRMYGLD